MDWAENAVDRIKKIRISHRNWKAAFSQACATLTTAVPGEVLCITGPSRAGKSRLIAELKNWIIGPDSISPGLMPVVTLLATNDSTGGSFSTKSFTTRALRAVGHFMFDLSPNSDRDPERFGWIARTPEGTFRSMLELALINRKTKYLFIDESQHIGYSQGHRHNSGAAAILDSWKCMAQTTRVILVLIGAYPLLDVIRLSPHLIGRKHNIHFPRYRPTPEDLLAFEEILEAYSQYLKLPKGVPSLRQWRGLLYEGSLGCIGLLESWLREALAVAIAHNASSLTLEHLLITKRSEADLSALASEIRDGEKALDVDLDIAPLQDSSKEKDRISDTKLRVKRKPFQKKPRRYLLRGRYKK